MVVFFGVCACACVRDFGSHIEGICLRQQAHAGPCTVRARVRAHTHTHTHTTKLRVPCGCNNATGAGVLARAGRAAGAASRDMGQSARRGHDLQHVAGEPFGLAHDRKV